MPDDEENHQGQRDEFENCPLFFGQQEKRTVQPTPVFPKHEDAYKKPGGFYS
jgi:hypothetical protein